MQDLIEGDDIPLWRLLAVVLHASVLLVISSLMPRFSSHDESF